MVSVIIPVYNIKDYIGKCIASVIGQTYKELEIILIDDGSMDGSGDICDRYAVQDERIKVIHTCNEGVSSARNKGLEIMRGDYVLFADGDDWLASNMIERLLSFMLEVNAQIVSCDAYQTDGNNFEVRNLYKYAGNKQILLESEKYDIIRYTATLWNKLIDTKIIKEKRFRKQIAYGEDLFFLVDILENANKVGIVYEPLYYYRNSRPGNVVSSTINTRYYDLINSNYLIYKILKEKNYKIAATIRLSYALNRTIEYIPIKKIPSSKKYLKLIKTILNDNLEIYDELKIENGIGKRRILTLKIAKYNATMAVICCHIMKKVSGK